MPDLDWAGWIPAPGNSIDLLPDDTPVRIVMTGIRRTLTEPAIVITDGMVIGDGNEPVTYSSVEYPDGDEGRHVYYREATS